jgi:hypothetical protein
MTLGAIVELVDLKHKKSEDVDLIEDEDQRPRQLHNYWLTRFPKISYRGCVYCPIAAKTLSYS